MSLQRSFLPPRIGEEVVRADLGLTPLRQVLEHKLGIAVRGARETVSAVRLGRREARELGCRAGAPAFESERLSYGAGGEPIVFDRVFIPGDRFRITRELHYEGAPCMKILVAVKQVPDTATQVKISADPKAIETAGVTWIVSPYDEFALEEALRIKEKRGQGEVVAVTMGPDRAKEALRSCLAMGADRAVHVNDPALAGADTLVTARALAAVIKQEGPALVLFGRQAIDDDMGAVAAQVAEVLGWPCASWIMEEAVDADAKSIRVGRQVEGGLEVFDLPLPAIVSAQKGLNEPRYPTLKGIMGAKKKEIKDVKAADLGVATERRSSRSRSWRRFRHGPPAASSRATCRPQSRSWCARYARTQRQSRRAGPKRREDHGGGVLVCGGRRSQGSAEEGHGRGAGRGHAARGARRGCLAHGQGDGRGPQAARRVGCRKGVAAGERGARSVPGRGVDARARRPGGDTAAQSDPGPGHKPTARVHGAARRTAGGRARG